ncbi:hypothetical protein VTK73DRAFT_3578 [Phialemonium thermophilum]|uniref:Kri1-like C-terminal domain-containing protein n=1 Tax=Phialemonium thermophilum TaxID=223376 RepID=A0ABR3WYY4_9PEZI
MPATADAKARGVVNGGPKIPKKKLFDDEDSSSEDEQEGGAALRSSSVELKINEEYARRFEHNKKREELHRLEEKYKSAKTKEANGDSGSETDSSEDETEDDEGFLITEDLDAEISATLQAIKNKDPRIYDKSAVFYKPFDPENDPPAKEKKEKPIYLRDYHRERYLRGEIGADDEENAGTEKQKTYAEEQDDLKQSILSEIKAAEAANDSEEWSGDEAFMKPKEKQPEKLNEDGIHPSRAAKVKLTEEDIANADKDPEGYLAKFMASRAWAEGAASGWEPFESDEGEDDDNLAEQFEHAYNMRFEDPEKSNEVLRSYSRSLVAARSVRKEELTGRKKQRMLEKEKKEAEKREREEERRRLRRLKLEEAQEKLKKIKEAAGVSGKALKEEDWIQFLDEAWDDERWEEEMKRRFGDAYYAEPEGVSDSSDEDDAAEGDKKKKKKKKKPKKPKWDDDIDVKDILPDFDDEVKPDITLTESEQEAAENGAAEEAEEEEESDFSDAERPAKKRKTTKDIKKERAEAKRQARQELARLEALVDTKLELEHPRALAKSSDGGKTGGFRYRETSPNSFGLTARDILLAPSDAALNEFAGLKKLATFRDEEKKRRDRKRLGKKARLRQWRREVFGRDYERTGPTFGFEALVARGDDEAANGGPSSAGGDRAADARRHKKNATGVNGSTGGGGGKGSGGNVVEGERKKKRKRSKNKKSAKGEEAAA